MSLTALGKGLIVSHDIAPRSAFDSVLREMYAHARRIGKTGTTTRVNYQELALVYMVLAMGVLHNLEVGPNDPLGEEYLSLAKACLVKGDFLKNNTIAGVQSLVCPSRKTSC